MTVNNFLYVKQGGISRWQYNDIINKTNEYGLFTDNFFNCIIIILREKTNQKLVMIHADFTIKLEDIQKEIEWCSKNCEKYIFYKEHAAAEETIDDIFAEDPLKNEFSLKLVLMTRKNGKIVEDIPTFPDGTRLPEFEATTVFASLDENITLYRAYKGKENIKDDLKIQEVYQRLQKEEWVTFANKRGSNSQCVDFESTKCSANVLFTSKHFKHVDHENKRRWASLSLRQGLYPLLDLLSKDMVSLNIKLGAIDAKFADKSSKTGWQLFEFEGSQAILANISLQDKETIDKLCEIISEHSKLTTHHYKSGESHCLSIKFLRHSALEDEIMFIRKNICKEMLISAPKFKHASFTLEKPPHSSKNNTPEVNSDQKSDTTSFANLRKGFLK